MNRVNNQQQRLRAQHWNTGKIRTLKKKGACFSLSPAPMLVTTATLEMPASFIAVMMFVVPSHQEEGEAEKEREKKREKEKKKNKERNRGRDSNGGREKERDRDK